MKTTLLAGVCSLAALGCLNPAIAANPHKDHAPAGIMGSHLHNKGDWMVAYYLDGSSQQGLRDGSDDVSAHDVLQTFGEVMTDMDMQMHMVEGMVGITDNLTLMLMGQYMEMDMTHAAHGGHGSHNMKRSGWGDTQLTALYGVMHEMSESGMQAAHLHMGVSVPTGDNEVSYHNHHNNHYHLPYSMQFGSGTFDPILGITYTGNEGPWLWGAQALGTFRFYDNSEGYHLGNRYEANLWGGYSLNDSADVTLRLQGISQGNVDGSDPMIPPTSMAGAQPNGQGSEVINAYAGLAITPPVKALEGHRMVAEIGAPLVQHFDGPQLKTDYRFTLGWQIGF